MTLLINATLLSITSSQNAVIPMGFAARFVCNPLVSSRSIHTPFGVRLCIPFCLDEPGDVFEPLLRSQLVQIIGSSLFLIYPNHLLDQLHCSSIIIFTHANIAFCKQILR